MPASPTSPASPSSSTPPPPQNSQDLKWTPALESRLLYVQAQLKAANAKWSEDQELWIDEVHTLEDLKRKCLKASRPRGSRSKSFASFFRPRNGPGVGRLRARNDENWEGKSDDDADDERPIHGHEAGGNDTSGDDDIEAEQVTAEPSDLSTSRTREMAIEGKDQTPPSKSSLSTLFRSISWTPGSGKVAGSGRRNTIGSNGKAEGEKGKGVGLMRRGIGR